VPSAERYEVALTAAAGRALHRLPENVAAAAIELIDGALAENPQRVGKPMRGVLEGHHVARRGEYRVVYRIDEEYWIVTFLAVGHRRDIYRRP